MRYYKSQSGAVFAFSDIQTVPGDMTALTSEEVDAHLNQSPAQPTADEVRLRRNGLLAQSDWTQLPDVPQATSALWTAYRQALRDVPQQSGFPSKITWPAAPDAA